MQNLHQLYYSTSTLLQTKYFVPGNYEEEIDETSGIATKYYYISGGDGLASIYIKKNEDAGKLHWVLKDHLGSIMGLYNSNGTLEEEFSYDAWGRRRDPKNWNYISANPSNMITRGYTGHEHLDDYALINMRGRIYDPVLGRMLSPDNYVQEPNYSQSLNRYSYCFNNPLIYTDPSGDFIFTLATILTGQWYLLPVAIGADVGMWQGGSMANGTMNPFKWDYSSGKTWGYMAGGAVVGGASGYIGGAVATSGMPFANTAGLVAGSFVNSVGTSIYTGGKTDASVNFGFGSYNFDTGEFGYIGKKGNSALENIGYGLGALANLRDINEVINSTQATLYTDNSDFISHSAIVDKNSGDPLMSFGPNDTKVPNTKLGYAAYFRRSTSDFHYNPTLPVDITVNKYAIDVVRGLGKVLPFQGITTNCVNMASLSLWLNGIPNIGLSPWILYGTVSAYNAGVKPDLFSYYFTQYGR